MVNQLTYGLEKSVAERQSNIKDTLQDKYKFIGMNK
jgi:hypothetical protein